MERLFIVRHGQREDFVNPGWKAQAPDPYDTPLSAHGAEQAEEVARFFAAAAPAVQPQRVLCSPYLRALQTAAPTAAVLDLPLCVEPGLAESEFRQVGGAPFPQPPTTAAAVRTRLGGRVRVDDAWTPLGPRATGFEDVAACCARARALVAALERAEEAGAVAGRVVLFTHAAMVIALMRAALRDDRYDSEIPVCGVCELVRVSGGGWQLVRDCDASMLRGGSEHAWNFGGHRFPIPQPQPQPQP